MFTKFFRRTQILNILRKHKTEEMSDIENDDMQTFQKQKMQTQIVYHNNIVRLYEKLSQPERNKKIPSADEKIHFPRRSSQGHI
jgi:hypothetical protein